MSVNTFKIGDLVYAKKSLAVVKKIENNSVVVIEFLEEYTDKYNKYEVGKRVKAYIRQLKHYHSKTIEKKLLSTLVDFERSSISDLQYDIIFILHEYGEMNRDRLVKMLKVPRTTVYDNLVRLINRNIVSTYPIHKKRNKNGSIPPGRPVVYFKLQKTDFANEIIKRILV